MNDSTPAFLRAWDACAARAARPLPAGALAAARRSGFDTAAAMVAGVRENCTQAAVRACEPTVSSVPDVALVLGTASHALDYDDVSMLATCHPSVPIIAALMALLPTLERDRPQGTFGEWLGAYALGTETMLRLGEWLGFRHYALGFHATSTLGTVGAAAAVAAMLGLPREQAHHALSIAASSACGLRANFGTDTKPLHVGFAAAGGLRAALLAQGGATASDDAWGASGYPSAFSGGQMPGPLTWTGESPWALERPGFEHKRFPSCYLTHRLIAGVLKIRERQPQAQGEAVRIDVELPRGGTAPLKHPRPDTGLQAKFSGPYCGAVAWLEGRVELASFSDEAVQRQEARAQMERVRVVERDTAGESLESAPVFVTVHGRGWTDSIVVDWAPGSSADPMTRDELRGKWRDGAAHAGLALGDGIALPLLDAPVDAGATSVLAPLRSALLGAATATPR